jgi:hypothetical protein
MLDFAKAVSGPDTAPAMRARRDGRDAIRPETPGMPSHKLILNQNQFYNACASSFCKRFFAECRPAIKACNSGA